MLNKNWLSVVLLSAITLAHTVQGVNGIEEGDNCIVNRTQEEGTCTKLFDCERPCDDGYVRSELCKKTPRRKPPIVCCPKARPTKSISAQKCLEYKELACTPYYVSSDEEHIVVKRSNCASFPQWIHVSGSDGGYGFNGGGVKEALRREFPHMALLGSANRNIFECEGILISDQFVLTAAYCLNNSLHGPISYVRLGEHDQSTQYDTKHIDVDVAELIPHPHYAKHYIYDDIGLIRLERPVTFTEAIRPACLPEEPITADIVNATASGWRLSNVLQRATLDLFDHNTCSNFYKPNRLSPQGIRETTQFCAGSETHIDNICIGHSGGPLQTNHKYHYCTYSIIGVTSFCENCANLRNSSIGVYTPVFPHLSWIESVVWPEGNASN